MEDEHRDLGAVLRGVPELLHFISRGIDAGRGDLVPQRSLARRQFDLIDRRRHGERLESEEGFLAVPAAAEAVDRADARKFDVAQRLALEIEKLELRAGVVLVLGQDFSVHDAGALQNAVRSPE